MNQENLFSNSERPGNDSVNDTPKQGIENRSVYSDIKCFNGFTCAIPLAYSDAIASCNFEKGNIFYDIPEAYSKWENALKKISYSLQVKSAPEFQILEDEEEEEKELVPVFYKNWNAEIKIELINYKQTLHKKTILTTQGRLFTFLWRANFKDLDINYVEPEIPLMVDEARSYLTSSASNQVLMHFTNLIPNNITNPNLFIMFYDPTNDTTASKYRNIYKRLSSEFSVELYDQTPTECNLTIANKLSPTITLKCVLIDSGKSETIRDAIKEVLWPKKTSLKAPRAHELIAKEKSTSPRPFNLSWHGIFYTHKKQQLNKNKIKTHSFIRQNTYYRYRLAIERVASLPNTLESLSGYLTRLFTDCPNHLFIESNFRVSGIDTIINVHTIHKTEHKLIKIAKESRSFKPCKSRHENLEKYMLENDSETIACEIPVWIEPGELKDYYEVFKTEEPFTGHIDILRYEKNGKIGVWDYKPNAYNDTKAKTQVFLYAFMLAVRTGKKLNDFVCGYFDEADVFMFNPTDIKKFTL